MVNFFFFKKKMDSRIFSSVTNHTTGTQRAHNGYTTGTNGLVYTRGFY